MVYFVGNVPVVEAQSGLLWYSTFLQGKQSQIYHIQAYKPAGSVNVINLL